MKALSMSECYMARPYQAVCYCDSAPVVLQGDARRQRTPFGGSTERRIPLPMVPKKDGQGLIAILVALQ
jgi:hypothetical protein